MRSTIIRVTVSVLAVSWPVSEFVAARAPQWGRTRSACSAYTEALVDRAHFVARTVLTSQAFRECSTSRLGTRYKNCADPNSADARGLQIAKILKAIERNNPLEYTCSYVNDSTSARAAYAPWGEHGLKVIDLSDDWMESFPDWATYRGAQPFNWRASDIVHEFMHTHSYQHPDSGCPADYKAGGIEPSAPYIVGDCVSNVVEESNAACAVFDAPPGTLNLVTHLKENMTGAQVCAPVSDPGLRVALRTFGGQYLSAVNGGGGAVDAHATAQGLWETMYVVDVNGGPLWSGEPVRIKTQNGSYLASAAGGSLAATMPPNNEDGPAFTMSRPGGGTAKIGLGDQIQLRSGANYVTAENGGGGAVNATRRDAREWETFTMVGPRRANVVRLVMQPGRQVVYVRRDGRLESAAVTTDEPSAFWVIDHNGGLLQSGDEVTFETLRSNKFIGVCDGSEFLAATADTMGGCTKFVVRKAGGGRIVHGDAVTLVTGDGRAVGLGTDGTLMRRPAGLTVPFTVRAVQGTRWPIE